MKNLNLLFTVPVRFKNNAIEYKPEEPIAIKKTTNIDVEQQLDELNQQGMAISAGPSTSHQIIARKPVGAQVKNVVVPKKFTVVSQPVTINQNKTKIVTATSTIQQMHPQITKTTIVSPGPIKQTSQVITPQPQQIIYPANSSIAGTSIVSPRIINSDDKQLKVTTIGGKKPIIVNQAKKPIQIGQNVNQGIFTLVKTSQGMGLQQTLPRVNIIQKQAVIGGGLSPSGSTTTIMSPIQTTQTIVGSPGTSSTSSQDSPQRPIVKLIQPSALGKPIVVKSPNFQIGKISTGNNNQPTFVLTNKGGQGNQQMIVVSSAPQMRAMQTATMATNQQMSTSTTQSLNTVVASNIKGNVNFSAGNQVRMVRATSIPTNAVGQANTSKAIQLRMPVNQTQKMTLGGKTVTLKTVTLVPNTGGTIQSTVQGQNVIQQGKNFIVMPRNVFTIPQGQGQVRTIQNTQVITQQQPQHDVEDQNIEQMDGGFDLIEEAPQVKRIRIGLFGGSPPINSNKQTDNSESPKGTNLTSSSDVGASNGQAPEPQIDEDDDIEKQINTVKIEKYDISKINSTISSSSGATSSNTDDQMGVAKKRGATDEDISENIISSTSMFDGQQQSTNKRLVS